jgi:hypothetical protein
MGCPRGASHQKFAAFMLGRRAKISMEKAVTDTDEKGDRRIAGP